jgi:selenide,water dikinase
MRSSEPVETDILLLGAGHAHVEVLRRFAMKPERGVRLTLVGREPETPYSGMLPGLIRGDYTVDQAHIDLAPLAAAAGARLILAEATSIDLSTRSIGLVGRPDIPFDLLSIDVGGTPSMPDGGGIPVKPIGRFLDQLQALENNLPPNSRIVVVGGGAGGVELALALAHRFRGQPRVTLVSSTPEPLASAPPRARRVARAALVDAGVELASGVMAGALADGKLPLSDGTALDAEAALWATSAVGPGFLLESGLICDPSGCVVVDNTLRSVSHDFVFAVGDCAALGRPKSGVWAVRAGAPLARNLRLAARRKPLRPWTPQRDALVILGLGAGRAVAWRNGITVAGRSAWRMKDWIDRRWMHMYKEMRMPADPADPMRCGGCGAKVGAEVLAGALASLPRSGSGDLFDAMEHPDDAAVMRPPAGRLLVQSVDHFRAFLDDPYVFGQVAAAHALSDIHAMGARPWTALAIASVPHASAAKMGAELSAMLRGATEVLNADGCTLVGGHSAEAAESALGFAVTGLAEPGKAMRKAGLHVGDYLILTKPLGTGVVLAGHMRGLTRAAWLQAAIASMCVSNAVAARVFLAHRATACTDVTGFGLAGHLREMLIASAVGAELWLDAIPLLPGALELAGQGVESTLAPDNSRALPGMDGGVRAALLIDPQTSGGLLGGVPPARAEGCLVALLATGLQAAVIGVVEPSAAPTIRLLGERNPAL